MVVLQEGGWGKSKIITLKISISYTGKGVVVITIVTITVWSAIILKLP